MPSILLNFPYQKSKMIILLMWSITNNQALVIIIAAALIHTKRTWKPYTLYIWFDLRMWLCKFPNGMNFILKKAVKSLWIAYLWRMNLLQFTESTFIFPLCKKICVAPTSTVKCTHKSSASFKILRLQAQVAIDWLLCKKALSNVRCDFKCSGDSGHQSTKKSNTETKRDTV